MTNFGIYIHIPFCVSKCKYCSFVSSPACEREISEYFEVLCNEIVTNSNKYKNKTISSIYIGGGTPSYVDEKYIQKIMNLLNSHYSIYEKAEITIECNPCSTTTEKLQTYKKSGINRISFGVQSLQNNELEIIGRKHSSLQAVNAISLAKQVGFDNISADLLIGIPEQTKETLFENIETLQKCGVNHISAYMLMLEEGTILFNEVKNLKVKVADEDSCVDLYNCAVEKLKSFGYGRYEISNFAKDGFESKHNQNYWEMGEYRGFGMASHSFVDDERFCNASNFVDYKSGIMQSEKLSNREIIEETIMLGLRQKKGVSVERLNKLNYNIMLEKKEQIENLLSHNLIAIENGYIRVTDSNFGVTSAIILELI